MKSLFCNTQLSILVFTQDYVLESIKMEHVEEACMKFQRNDSYSSHRCQSLFSSTISGKTCFLVKDYYENSQPKVVVMIG